MFRWCSLWIFPKSGQLGLKEGEEVEIEVKKNPVETLVGMIKISNKKWVDEIIESPDLEPV